MITITLSNLLNSHPFFLYFFNKSFIKRLILFFAIFPVILMQSMAYADGLIYLPQTGQTKCYNTSNIEIPCSGTGQDGEIRAGVPWPNPRFTVGTGIESDCIIDNLTGLMWARRGKHNVNWYEALSYTSNLNLCGYSDWRLPNVNELESLVNSGVQRNDNWLISQGFLDVRMGWTSTTPPNSPDAAWNINEYGEVNGFTKVNNSSYSMSALPVRGGAGTPSGNPNKAEVWRTGQTVSYAAEDDGSLRTGITWPTPRFTDNGDGTVIDNLTGLIWTKDANTPGPSSCIPNVSKSLPEALTYIKCLNTNNYLGYSDWRLPNRKELLSLIDRSRSNPALPQNHPFNNINIGAWYISSNPSLYDSNGRNTLVAFYGGSLTYALNSGPVWPVRGGLVNPNANYQYTLSISKSGTGSGIIISSPTGINCGATCTASFPYNTTVTLTATADPGSTFAGWDGACTGTGTCIVTMDNVKNVTATFNDITPPTTTPSIQGGTYNLPQSVTLTTNEAATIYYTMDGSDPKTSATRIQYTGTPILINTTTILKYYGVDSSGNAEDVKSVAYTIEYGLTVNKAGAGSGIVTSTPEGVNCGSICNKNYNNIIKVTLNVVPSDGSYFKGWIGEGCSGTGACIVTMDGPKIVTAVFGLINETGTNVSGIINTNTTWTLSNSPYNVTGNILVNQGVTLTIQPGVVVKFDTGKSLQINGTLIARGTKDAKIVFTSKKSPPSPGDWGYLFFTDSSVDASYDENGNYISGSIMEHCIVEYAGGASVSNNGAIRINNASPYINYSTILKSVTDGLVLWDTGSPKIKDTIIRENNGNGIKLNTNQSVIIHKSQINKNKGDGIALTGNGNFTIQDCNVTENNGKGINIVQASGDVKLIGTEIARNSTGIYTSSANNVIISNAKINNNFSNEGPGGINAQFLSKINISNTIINANSGRYGGGIHADYGSNVSISHCYITNNNAIESGGGIATNRYYGSGNLWLDIKNTIIADNFAGISGGVFAYQNNCCGTKQYITISNSSLIGNKSTEGNIIALDDSGEGSFSFTRNLITKNSINNGGSIFKIFMPGTLSMNNLFHNSSTYLIYNNNPSSSANIDAKDNFWGTSSNVNILDMIYDWFDDTEKGLVDFLPFFETVIPDAPISPPRNVRASVSGDSIILNWDANPEPDVAGYKVYWSATKSGYPYENVIDVGNVTSYTLTGITGGAVIAVTAYDTGYSLSKDDPSTIINENQTNGNESWYSEEILTDKQGPTGTVTINNGETHINTRLITLNLSANDSSGVTEMMISNNPSFVDAVVEPYTATKKWMLNEGDGTKTVYVKFKDTFGNWSEPISKIIILDTKVNTVAKPAGGIYGKSLTVTLNANEPATIYYTTDGTEPTTNSTVYTAAIPITQTTTLKYFAVDSLGNIEPVKIQRYTIIRDGYISVAAGASHSLAIKSDGTLWAWGRNEYGQLGDGTIIYKSMPVQIGNDTNWVAIAAGDAHSLALKSDGTLWAWGKNASGQLGDGTLTNKHTPVQIGTDKNWVAISAGSFHSIALKSDGTLWAWGWNGHGQLGDGTTIDRSMPVQIGTDKNWVAISAGPSKSIALKSDGTLWEWGRNNDEYGFAINRATPVQIGNDTNWIAVAAGDVHSLALKSDGTLWAWGYDNTGALGTGVTSYTPTKIGTKTDWIGFTAGYYHSLALKSDGTLWAWGYNSSGQLGDNTTTNKNTPVQIGTDTNWIAIKGGALHSLALKSDGTLWAWGDNYFGELGDGTTTNKNNPVQIGGPVYTPKLSLTPSSKDFGSVEVGHSSSAQSFTINNTGNVDLAISSITIEGTDASMFSLNQGTCTSLTPTITPSATCTVNVTFSPQSTGTKQATLKIVSNDPNTPTSFAVLTGTGYINDFSIMAEDVNIVKGESRDITITVIANNLFNSPVTLSLENIPQGITASISPYTLTPTTEGVKATITVNTSPNITQGTYNIRVTGIGGGVSKTKDINVIIAPEMTLPSTTMFEAVKGTPYSTTISVSGGVPPYTVTLLSGTLPEGLVLSYNGTISGTPSQRGIYSFTVKAEDAQGHTAIKEFSLRIYDTNYRQLALESSSWTVEKNALTGWITVKVLDDYGNPANVTSNTMIQVKSSSLSGRFTIDGASFSVDNTLTPIIPSNFNSVMFRYKDSTSGNFTLTASGINGTPSQGWGSSSQTITVTSPTLKNASLNISISENPTYGQGVVVSGTLKDAQTQTPLNNKNINIIFTSPSGSATQPVSVTTTSNGSFSYTAGASTIDTAGTWGVQVTFNDSEPVEYNSLTYNTNFNVSKANASVTIVLDTGSISPTGTLTVSGQITAYTFIPVDLSNIQIKLNFIEPNGAIHKKTVTTYDRYGHFKYQYSGEFNTDGLWTVTAEIASNPNLNDSKSQSVSLNVATSAGYAILIEGESGTSTRPYYTASLNDIYAKLKKRSFTDENIYYLSYEGTNYVNVDAPTTKANIKNAIENWAFERILQGGLAPLWIIMIDHGDTGRFYIDPDIITPIELNEWITNLESKIQATLQKSLTTIIVNGSCYSGSFIPQLSKQNRIIITSATHEEKSAQGPKTKDTNYGEYFIYYLFSYLSKGEVLKDAFREAAHITQLYFKESEANCGNNNLCKQDKTRQHPLLDDNGDGKGSWMNIVGQEDGGVTSKLVLGLGTNPNVLSWQEVMPTTTTLGNTLTTWAKTSDPSKTVASWVEIKKPSFVATEASSGQVALNLPRTMGSYNKDSNRWEYNLTNLDEKGLYTLFYYAMDSGGDLIPPAIGTIYVDTQTNNPPLPFTTGSPTMNQDVNDAMMIFRWNPAYDPDGDKLTYTLRIYEDLNNSKGTEIKRYELIPQEAYPINAFKETRNDGITPLFTTGNYYWFDVEAIDGKGKSVFSNAVRFRITFTNALTGIITGIIYSDVDSSKITTANITASVGSVFLLSNGSYIISVPSGTSNINITTTATGFESASKSNISINPGEIKTLNIPMTSIKTDTLLSLSSGWNFISLPYQPTDTNIMSALSSILNNVRMVWGYDNRDKEWMVYKSNVQGSLFKVLNTIETGKGYWIYMNAPTIFDMSNWTSGSRSISLNKGWNLIGWNGDNGIAINDALNNLGSKWDIIWGWENGIWKAKHSNPEINLNVEPLNNLNRGRAYWIKMNTSTEWMQ